MRLLANAKINFGLFITERRQDGYHNIESLFVPIDWADEILIQESSDFSFSSEGIEIPSSKHGNHCIQAFDIIHSKHDIPNVSIHLKKNIPIGAGLGGGSSDAAFVLKGLNEKFKLNLSVEQLESYALEIGSDCPFFVKNQAAFVHGTGNKFEDYISANFKGYCLLIYPNLFISTKEAYAGIQPKKPVFDLRTIGKLSKKQWHGAIINDFEVPLNSRYPEIETIKKTLYEMGAVYSSLSGSGSTIYGLFENKPMLWEAFKEYQVHLSEISI